MDNQELISLIDELLALPKEAEWAKYKSSTMKPPEGLGKWIQNMGSRTKPKWDLLKNN